MSDSDKPHTPDRLLTSQAAARSRMLQQLDQQEAAIVALDRQLAERDAEIANLREAEQAEGSASTAEPGGQVALHRQACEKDPRNIAAEDALDTIVRLENTLKLAQRRNQLIAKENAAQLKLVNDRTVELQRRTVASQELVALTGFHDGLKTMDVDGLLGKVAEMEALEKTLTDETKTARVIMRKKGQLVESLIAELAQKKAREDDLCALHNNIRVKDRDVQQVLADIERLKATDRKTDGALVAAENRRDVVALSSLQGDKEFLQREIAKQRELRRGQDEIVRLQLRRATELEERVEVIIAALRDLKLDQKMERSVAKSGTVVVDIAGEPDDRDRIQPPNETVPLETYDLLVHDLESVKSGVSRKDIILLEKAASAKALEDKVEQAAAQNADEQRQHQHARKMRRDWIEQRQMALGERLSEYRHEIDSMLATNLQLRNEIDRMSKAPPVIATANGAGK